jgi:hypothetical protein
LSTAVWTRFCGDHRLSKATVCNEDDVVCVLHKVEREERLDEAAINLGGPVPIEVGHWFPLRELALGGPSFEPAPGSLGLLDERDVLDDFCRAPALLGRACDDVWQLCREPSKAERDEACGDVWFHTLSRE